MRPIGGPDSLILKSGRVGSEWGLLLAPSRIAVLSNLAPKGISPILTPAPGGRLCLEAIPDASVRDEIIRRVNGSALQPVCETVMKRAASELSLANKSPRFLGFCAAS